ncbi:hypothetical protein GOODEAATRI_029705, partial [Goodea atripinnis]
GVGPTGFSVALINDRFVQRALPTENLSERAPAAIKRLESVWVGSDVFNEQTEERRENRDPGSVSSLFTCSVTRCELKELSLEVRGVF